MSSEPWEAAGPGGCGGVQEVRASGSVWNLGLKWIQGPGEGGPGCSPHSPGRWGGAWLCPCSRPRARYRGGSSGEELQSPWPDPKEVGQNDHPPPPARPTQTSGSTAWLQVTAQSREPPPGGPGAEQALSLPLRGRWGDLVLGPPAVCIPSVGGNGGAFTSITSHRVPSPDSRAGMAAQELGGFPKTPPFPPHPRGWRPHRTRIRLAPHQ